MSKAILVIDMPKTCKECEIMFKGDYSDWCPWVNARTDVFDYIRNNTKPDWCPLKNCLNMNWFGMTIVEAIMNVDSMIVWI
jgi:hypothetical protein